MGGFFNPDSMFSRIMTRAFDLMLVNLLWIICCIPVITIGASTTAMYYMTMKMVKDEEGGIIKGFFKSFKQNFKQSVPITLIYIVFCLILFMDFHIIGSNTSKYASFMYGALIVVAEIGFAVICYTFPVLARFENTVKNTILNAMKIALSHLWQTIVILILNSAVFAWIMISPSTFLSALWLWIFIGFALVAYACSFLYVRIFAEFMPPEEDDDDLDSADDISDIQQK